MRTRRDGWRRPTWMLMALLLSFPLLGSRCPEDDDGSGSGGSSGGLNAGEGNDDGAEDGDPAGEGGDIDVDFNVCVEEDCGPALGMPNWECADGSLAGPTGACIPTADGSCGWEVATCDDDDPGDGGGGGSDCPDGNVDPATGCGSGGDGGCECSDPAPGMPNWMCDDGTVGGPSCVPDADGTCGWQIRECGDGGGGDPGDDGNACHPESCPDPAPGMPNYICVDGTVGGPVCEANADGTCSWHIRDCPDSGGGEECECPDPAPGMPNWICDDGSIGGPVCQTDPATGTCAWAFLDCPEPEDCGAGDACDACPGPAPGMPNWECENGCVGGPACLYAADGTCSWHILDCP